MLMCTKFTSFCFLVKYLSYVSGDYTTTVYGDQYLSVIGVYLKHGITKFPNVMRALQQSDYFF
jgi:hypothetical protein